MNQHSFNQIVSEMGGRGSGRAKHPLSRLFYASKMRMRTETKGNSIPEGNRVVGISHENMADVLPEVLMKTIKSRYV